MFILSSISSGLDLWSAHDTSIYENPNPKVFENLSFLGQTIYQV